MSRSAEIVKLGPVLDLSAASEFLAMLRQRAPGSTTLHLDASEVEIITPPCMQIMLSAIKSGHNIAIENASAAFADAFADLAIDWPRGEGLPDIGETPDAAAGDAGDQAPALDLGDAEVGAVPIAPDLPGADGAGLPEPDQDQARGEAMAKRILTIDDSKTIRDMLRMTLVDAGYDVLQAVDGEDGVGVMDRETVDLVITDINMPKMNGYEVVRHLRANPALKGLPILVLTTESDSDKKNLAREAGATGWMVKPFDPERLVATVKKVIP
jgi:two-component system chemotaxis response regulator CheY